jgi:hypothetical protein
MIISVVSAKYLQDFKINITLRIKNQNSVDNIEKIIDLQKYIANKKDHGIFYPLKNKDYFQNFKVVNNTIEWENGADIAPERFLEL